MLGRLVRRHGGDKGHTVMAGETGDHVVLADPSGCQGVWEAVTDDEGDVDHPGEGTKRSRDPTVQSHQVEISRHRAVADPPGPRSRIHQRFIVACQSIFALAFDRESEVCQEIPQVEDGEALHDGGLPIGHAERAVLREQHVPGREVAMLRHQWQVAEVSQRPARRSLQRGVMSDCGGEPIDDGTRRRFPRRTRSRSVSRRRSSRPTSGRDTGRPVSPAAETDSLRIANRDAVPRIK